MFSYFLVSEMKTILELSIITFVVGIIIFLIFGCFLKALMIINSLLELGLPSEGLIFFTIIFMFILSIIPYCLYESTKK